FDAVEIELGNPVVLIGPNNSGKTTALQALALWDIGLRRWNEKRAGKATPEKRPGVTINRRDLIAVPVPDANLLWRDLHVRDVQKEDGDRLWARVHERIESLFGIALDKPAYIAERGEITMTYREASRVRLDLSSSGRGLQQTLLLLAHLAGNPGSVLLLDEPDAHLE